MNSKINTIILAVIALVLIGGGLFAFGEYSEGKKQKEYDREIESINKEYEKLDKVQFLLDSGYFD